MICDEFHAAAVAEPAESALCLAKSEQRLSHCASASVAAGVNYEITVFLLRAGFR